MLFKQLTCVGISKEWEAGESVQCPFLVILLGCVILRLSILRYHTAVITCMYGTCTNVFI
jgi:hypothetical protein